MPPKRKRRLAAEDGAAASAAPDATIKLSARYLDEFIKLQCAPMLLEAGVFPDAKEISEAMAAFNAYRQFVRPNVPLQTRTTPTAASLARCGRGC